MSPITHDPQATENTINELTQLKKQIEKRQTYLKENFTPQHLKTDHFIDTWWCGTAYQANEDALTTIHKQAQHLYKELDTTGKKLDHIIKTLKQFDEEFNNNVTTTIDQLEQDNDPWWQFWK